MNLKKLIIGSLVSLAVTTSLFGAKIHAIKSNNYRRDFSNGNCY